MKAKNLYYPEKIASRMSTKELQSEILYMSRSINKYLKSTALYKQPEYIKVLKHREKGLFKTVTVGKKGKRKSLPNASVLIHQPLISGGGISGPTADILIEAKQSIYQGQAAIRALNNNLKRYKSITVEVLKELKKGTAAFLESSTSYQNTAFDYITAAERIEIDYLMKVTRNFDLKAVENMSEKMNAYFNNAEKRLTVILDLLKKAGENLQ